MTSQYNKETLEREDNLVGEQLRKIRTDQGLSLRSLANLSGLNINTLSLIENGKNSPSVSTLQQIAQALEVPITAFFAPTPVKQDVIFTRGDNRPEVNFNNAKMQDLGRNFTTHTIQPFVVNLQSGFNSGEKLIIHPGYELVYCLTGSVLYSVNQNDFLMNPGDSLLFEAHLPHRWKNPYPEAAQILLVIIPVNHAEDLSGQHFIKRSQDEDSGHNR